MSPGPVLIMAGGTGGHVFPGIAVAEVLRERKHAVIWLGTRRGLEARVVPEQGIEIVWISVSGVRRSGWLAWALAPFKIGVAVAQVLGMLYRRRPAAVLGLGGFVSGPGGIAAWIARRPLLIHEQNAIAGTTNRLLARFAQRVFEAFPGSFPRGIEAECIGNPVRATIANLARRRHRSRPIDTGPLRLLVLGGSQGALALNRCVPAAIARLTAAQRPHVRHQAGNTLAEAKQCYERVGVTAELLPFIDDMAAAYEWADLVVARAGALTIAELSAAGVGALLVPYPYAVDDHQNQNAAQFVEAGAGLLIAQSELDPERLAAELERLIVEPGRLTAMAERSRALAKPDAAKQLADACVVCAELRP